MSNTPFANPLIHTPTRALPKSVAIIGAGTIGPDIGYYLLSSIPGLQVILVDVDPKAIERAQSRIEGYIAKGLAKRRLTEAQAASVRDGLSGTLDYAAIADCDWVLEAATEDLDLKRRIFAQVEAIVRPDTLITSNTSSMPAERIFRDLTHKRRATVTHFFAPAFRNPAVEVIRWDETDPAVVEYLRWVFASTGKVPMVTEDAMCFMLDRVFDNWCNEAAYLLEGATASEVDSVSVEFVHAGPFFVLNMARGNPIIIHTNTLQMEEGDHYRPAPIFRSVDTWVTLKAGRRIDVAPEAADQIRDRLLGVLMSQSVDILDRGIASAADLNLGCCLALGFKTGPLDLMRNMGHEEVGRILARFGHEREGMPQPQHDLETYQTFWRHVLVDDVDGVKVLTLRRPQAMNALDDAVTDELLAIIRAHETDPAVRGFVIIGYGDRAFCAGADIGRFPEMLGDFDAATQYARDCGRLLRHIDAMDKPVVAALNGMALGGGLELAVRCHGIVASKSAWLQFPEVKLGIVPGLGGMVVPYRRWPQAATVLHEMCRVADKLPAAKAHELGIVDGLADSYSALVQLAVTRVGELEGALPGLADAPVELPPLATVDAGGRLSQEVIGIIEDAIRQGAQAATWAEALEVGYTSFGRSACTAAATEGIEAFLKRRKPDFGKTG